MIDLSTLPNPEIIETLDFEQILAELKAEFASRSAEEGLEIDVLDLESEPAVKILEAAAFRELRLRARANEVARNQILAFSKSTDLDHLGSFHGVARLVGETDERLRERIQLATIGGSTGGTHERLKSIAMGVSVNVRNIATWTTGRDPTVNIAVLSTDIGGNADAELLSSVETALENPSAKLVSDRYNVVSAVSKTVDLELDVTLSPEVLEETLLDLPGLIRGSRDKEDLLGLDLTISWITAAAMQPGVTDVVVKLPNTNVSAEAHEAIEIGAVSIHLVGRDR